MITTIHALAGLVAVAPPPLQSAPTPNRVDPVAIASVRRVDGRLVRTSEWVACGGQGPRGKGLLVFDCFQPDEDHAPTGGLECYVPGGGYRWWFGSGYHAPAIAEDMTFDPAHSGELIEEYSFSWGYGIADGTPLGTSFVLALFTYNEMIDEADCSASTIGVFPHDFTPASDGMLANFGRLPRGQYYANVDNLTELGMLMPHGPSGTYEQLCLWMNDATEEFSIPLENISPFLWGTAEDGGLPDRPGTQDKQGYYDDGGSAGKPDLAYDPATECYDMTMGVCPDPLGNMGAFWVLGFTICPGDHNRDCFITGVDYDLFVADFEAGCLDDEPPCTNSADHDDNGFITGIDFDLFVADFEAGCL